MTFRDEVEEILEHRRRVYRHFRGKAYQFAVTGGLAEDLEHMMELLAEDEAVIREVQWMLLQSDERIELSFDQVTRVLDAFMRVLKSEVPETEKEEEFHGSN